MNKTPEEFLRSVLDEQTLKEDSPERTALLAEHEQVRSLPTDSA